MIRWACGIIVLAFLGACDDAADRPDLSKPIMMHDRFSTEAVRYNGQTVRMRGYLKFDPTDSFFLMLYEAHTTSALENVEYWGSPIRQTIFMPRGMMVWDSSSNRQFTNPQPKAATDATCTNHYVEIVGTIGWNDLTMLYGMREIHAIRTFADASFSGEGRPCYRSGADSNPLRAEFEILEQINQMTRERRAKASPGPLP